MLSAWDLGGYEKNTDIDFDLASPVPQYSDNSGLAYFTDGGSEYIYVINNKSPTRIFKLNTDGTYANQNILLTNFDDPEAITHITGNYFAILEEKDQDTDPNVEEFHITIVTITSATTTIDKDSLDQNAPDESPPQSGIIKMTHADPDDGGGNQGPEGLAYDTNGASDGYFYIAKERKDGSDNNVFLFRVPDKGGTTVSVDVDKLTFNRPATPHVTDISEIYFQDVGGDGGRLFIMSEESSKVLMVDLDADGLGGSIVKVDSNPVLRTMPSTKYEGMTFSPDGFEMYVVRDNSDQHFVQYRNFTALTPNAAPDVTEVLNVDGTAGNLDDDLITDTTPTFTGRLERTVGGLTVPVKDAWAILYKDGVATSYKDETDSDGDYSITVTTALGTGDYEFSIRVGEDSTSAAAKQSIASAALGVVIHDTAVPSDLTGDGYVDFEDLTVLLANWNTDGKWADGDLSGTFDTAGIINFQDLTVLLSDWTEPGGAASPEATSVWPANGVTVYSASIDVYIGFSEEVQGVDASDLQLFGLGGIEATVGTPTIIQFTDVWQFPVSGLLPGAVDAALALGEGDITDMAGNSIEPMAWSFVVDPGLWLNEDGTGDVALAADFLGLSSTAVTVEVTFVSDDITAGTDAGVPIFAYVTDDKTDAFTLFIEKDSPNNMKLSINDVTKTMASGANVTDAGAVRSGYALAA